MDQPVKSLTCIQKAAEDSTSMIHIEVDCLLQTVECMSCQASLLKSELTGEVIKLSQNMSLRACSKILDA